MTEPSFERYVGVDYSGAQTADSGLPGLRAYLAEGDGPAGEVPPPPGPKRHWTRRALAHWLAELLEQGTPTLIGIDHGFSVPLAYFERHALPLEWPAFLDDFRRHWPTDEPHTPVEFVRDGLAGAGDRRTGDSKWRRLTERRAGAKSVFHFDVPGSVAKSTHAGLPWLRLVRERVGERAHFWPFDGWSVPAGRSAVAEAYPSLWSREFARAGRTPDQHDAFSVAAHLQRADRENRLAAAWHPELTAEERAVARFEGWILGVG